MSRSTQSRARSRLGWRGGALRRARTRGALALRLTDANAAPVAAICARLEACRSRSSSPPRGSAVLSPAGIASRLDRPLELLAGGRRDVDERQRTLEATIGWSYDLLRDTERQALARVSVFPAGFALEDAETVCGAGLDELAALTEQSLIRRDVTADDGAGFRFLRVIREYALEAPGWERRGRRDREPACRVVPRPGADRRMRAIAATTPRRGSPASRRATTTSAQHSDGHARQATTSCCWISPTRSASSGKRTAISPRQLPGSRRSSLTTPSFPRPVS